MNALVSFPNVLVVIKHFSLKTPRKLLAVHVLLQEKLKLRNMIYKAISFDGHDEQKRSEILTVTFTA